MDTGNTIGMIFVAVAIVVALVGIGMAITRIADSIGQISHNARPPAESPDQDNSISFSVGASSHQDAMKSAINQLGINEDEEPSHRYKEISVALTGPDLYKIVAIPSQNADDWI